MKKKTIAFLLAASLLCGMLPIPAGAALTNGGAETVSPTDSTFAEGWVRSGTGASKEGAIIRTDEDKRSGEYSIKITDTDGSSYQAYTPNMPVTLNTEYIGRCYVKTVSLSAGTGLSLFFEFKNAAGTRVGTNRSSAIQAASPDDFRPLSVLSSTTAGTVTQAALFANTNGGPTATAYFDDFELEALTLPLLLEHIEEKLAYEGTAAELLYALQTRTGSFEGVAEANASGYQARLLAARTAKGSALTKAEIQSQIDAENTAAAAKADIAAVKAALTTAGASMTLSQTGPIPLPAPTDAKGVSLAWTAVSGDGAGYVSVSEGNASLTGRPVFEDGDAAAQLILTLSKDGESDTLAYAVAIVRQMDPVLIAQINAKIDEGDAAGLYASLAAAQIGAGELSEEHSAAYLTRLSAAKSAKGSPLTVEEIEGGVRAANAYAEDVLIVAEVIGALETDGTERVLGSTGEITPPSVSDPKGTHMAFTAAMGDLSPMVEFRGGKAYVTTRPLSTQADRTGTLTLTVSKGEASATLSYSATLQRYRDILLPITNPSFEDAALETGEVAGWTIGGSETPFNIWPTDELSFIGGNSLYMLDNGSNASRSAASVRVDAAPGRIYTATVQAWAISGKTDAYLEFYSKSGTRIHYVTFPVGGDRRWEKGSATAVAPAGTDSVRLLLNSTRGNLCELYFDEALLFEMSAETGVANINSAAAASDVSSLMLNLKNATLGFERIEDTSATAYLAAIRDERAVKGSDLTQEELGRIVEEVNQAVFADNTAILDGIEAALEADGLTLDVTGLGSIEIPAKAETNGAAASWTAVSGDIHSRIYLNNGEAIVETLPVAGEGEESVLLTLTLRKGAVSRDVVYAAALKELTGDHAALYQVQSALSDAYIAGGNESLWDVRDDLNLPSDGAVLGVEGAAIAWSASAPGLIAADGRVTRPAYSAADEVVSLRGTITYNGATAVSDYLVRVRSIKADAGARLTVPNDSFEDTSRYSYENWLNNWVFTHVTAAMEPSRDMAFSGKYSLKCVDPDSSAIGGARTTNLYGASEGNLYKASVLYYSEVALPTLYLEFWDSDGLMVRTAKVVSATAANRGKWSILSVEDIAPAGTVYVTALLYSNAGTSGTTYFDCAMMEEYPLPMNGNFEAGLTGGLPSGWSLSAGAADAVSITPAGELRLNGAAALTSEKKAMSAGSDVVAQLDARLISGTAEITLASYDAGGALLNQTTQQVSGADSKTCTLRLSPANAAASVAVTVSAQGEACFDNLTVEYAPVGTTVYNGDFEKSAGSAVGWTGGSLSTGNVQSGSYSLEVGPGGTASSKIPVYEGKEYVLTADLLAQSGVSVTIDFYSNEGTLADSASHSVPASDGWQRLQLSVGAPIVAPARNSYAVVSFTSPDGAAYIDNVDFFAVTTSVSNASFESAVYLPAGTFPVNWSATGDAYANGTTKTAGDTITSLKIIGRQGEARSSFVSIQPGKAYTAYADALSEAATGAITLRFWTEDFQQTGEAVSAPASGSGWTTCRVSAASPGDAAYATVCLSGSDNGPVWFDSVKLEESVKEIGTRWQLLIDDYLVESTSNMVKTLHQAEKQEGLPGLEQGVLIKADKKWEGLSAYMYGTVLWDEEEQLFKLWYQTTSPYVCYATSANGIHWEKPSLGVYSYQGSTANNILLNKWLPTVFKDRNEPDPSRRYKMIVFNDDYQDSWYCLYFSPDGIRWTFHKNLVFGADVVTAAYDETNGVYVMSAKINSTGKRLHRMTTSPDLLEWTAPVKMNSIADPLDAYGYLRADSYGMAFYIRDGVYVGFNEMFQITNGTGDGPIDLRLLFSRDLTEDWMKVSQTPVLPRGEDGTFDDGMVFTASYPLVVGDEIWMYYSGWNEDHDADYRDAKIGLAKWRLDGFVSRDAGGAEGVLTTKPFIFEGNALRLNADASAIGGQIRVELLDSSGAVIQGYSKEDCGVISTDSVEHVVSWRGKTDLSALAGRVVQMKLYAQNSQIYAFAFGGEKAPEPETPTTPSAEYFSIIASAGQGGSIAPSGSRSVTAGASIAYSITPNEGYRISDVLVDGRSVGAVSSYTFSSVGAGHTIHAVFAPTQPGALPFTDVREGDWFAEAVRAVHEAGLFGGMTPTSFAPNAPMTRAMFVTVLGRLYEHSGSRAASSGHSFDDVRDGLWYSDYVGWAVKNGIITGYDDHTFGTDDPITREQMCAMLIRFAAFAGIELPANYDAAEFDDAGSISSYAENAVRTAQQAGLVDGMGDNLFSPRNTATRAQVATIFMRLMEMLAE